MLLRCWVPCLLPFFVSAVAAEVSADDARLLWAALQRASGYSNDELRMAAEELLELPPPSQVSVWQEHVRCGSGKCAGELGARVLASLTEAGKLPLRGFEPFPGDPLLPLWRKEDRTEFQSWASEEAHKPTKSLGALIPEGQPLATGRWQAAEFTRRAREVIVNITSERWGAVGRCLEWDTPHYTVKGIGGICRWHDVLIYADKVAEKEDDLREYNYGTRLLQVDILNPPSWTPRDYGLIVCLFVLEHVPEPERALHNIVSMMTVGGFLLLGAPFLDGVHGCPEDFYRYTPQGMQYLVESAGLEVLLAYGPGGPAVTAGEFIGMKSAYWDMEKLLQESDTHPINVFLLARKPWRGRSWRLPPRHNRTRGWKRQNWA